MSKLVVGFPSTDKFRAAGFFVRIRCKHLEYTTSEVSPLYTGNDAVHIAFPMCDVCWQALRARDQIHQPLVLLRPNIVLLNSDPTAFKHYPLKLT